MTMTCSRCHSLMVPDFPVQCYGSGEDLTERTYTASLRCVCCGNYEDAVILANRAKQAQELQSLDEAHVITAWAESLAAQAA